MNVHERILSILLSEKIMSDPKHACKIGVSIVNQKKDDDYSSLAINDNHCKYTKEEK